MPAFCQVVLFLLSFLFSVPLQSSFTPSSISLFFVTLSFYYLHLFRFLMFCFSYIFLIPRHDLTLAPDLFFFILSYAYLPLDFVCSYSYVLLFRYSPAIPLFSTFAVFLSRRFPISPYSYSTVPYSSLFLIRLLLCSAATPRLRCSTNPLISNSTARYLRIYPIPLCSNSTATVKNAVELLGAFRPDVEKIQYH